MNAEELAQRVADKLDPPYTSLERRNLPLKQLKEQYPDPDDWYVPVEKRAKPADMAYVVIRDEYAEDRGAYIRAATYLEVSEAVLEILKEGQEQ